MYKKKLSTIAIITILTLSTLLAVMPMAYAIGIPSLEHPITSAPLTSGPVGTKVDVTGTGATAFGMVEVYWDTLATKISEGYADSATNYDIKMVTIPEDLVGVHNVIVFDTLSSTIASTTFTITSEIKLSTTKGLPGDSLTVTGTGFGKQLEGAIYLGAITTVAAESVTLAGTPVTGTLAHAPVVIGTVALTVGVSITGTVNGVPVTGTGTVAVTDDGEGNLAGTTVDIVVDDGVVVESGEVDVTITGSINYATGVMSLVATGVDSAAGTGTVTGIVVTMTTPCTAGYDYAAYEVTPVTGVTTSALGSFDAAVTIPAIAETSYGAYTVTALDTGGNTDTATLTVDYYITLKPTSGPTGITVTISGRIEATTAYNLLFNGAPIGSGTSGSDGVFSNTYVIPTVLSTGSYPVDVVWKVTKKKTETFTVTAPPQVVYAPTTGVAGTVVTISTVTGFPFSANANITLYLGTVVVNSTQLDDRFGPTVAFGPAAGTFTNLEFTVPTTLTPGPYALKVVDEYGASTVPIYTFTVLPTPVTTITLNSASYYQGDTLSFTFVSTDVISAGPTCTIRDPTGATWWMATWGTTVTGPITTVLYQWQLFGVDEHATLPADAPLGTWNWTITYTPVSTGVSTKATGLFTVATPPTMQTVLDRLDELEVTITDVVTDSEGDLTALINTKAGPITTKLDAISPKLQAIEDTAVIIATMLGEVQVDLAALDLDAMGVDITAIKGDVATIKTNIGTVTASVSALDAKVTSISGDVATVSTTLGTLEGTVTSIDGKVATIDTEVGTVQADVTDILAKPDVDMTPVWIAVVLSLIAAIAAIFAVVTIRQKIAG
jgi:hypothetical protein